MVDAATAADVVDAVVVVGDVRKSAIIVALVEVHAIGRTPACNIREGQKEMLLRELAASYILFSLSLSLFLLF